MADPLKVAQVFVPGKLPEVTYNPREDQHLERDLGDYLDETGAILTVAGPTKTGKSVLLKRVIEAPVWVDGQGIESTDELWAMVSDQLGAYHGIEVSEQEGATAGGSVGSKGGFGPVLELNAQAKFEVTEGGGRRFSVERPVPAVARQMLEQSGRALVIDDFHFIGRDVQREIVRALKPSVLAGVPIVLASVSHRVQDVVTAEPDMTGRVEALRIRFWSIEDLMYIARTGFAALNLVDPDETLARRLASECYGSPHLMQRFCRELCKENGVRERPRRKFELKAPDNWTVFFQDQVDPASRDWFERLLMGPATRGTERTQWPIAGESDLTLDGYGVTLLAIASTGPKLELTRAEIQEAVERVVKGQAPAGHQTTRVLQHMTTIAEKRMTERQLTEEEMEHAGTNEVSVPDVQPVLEYMEDETNSRLHIADPFFAFFMRWGSARHLKSNQPVTLVDQPILPEA